MSYIEYSSNNSGGGWWLGDKDWKALEEAGWEVEWVANWTYDEENDFDPRKWLDPDGRYLGALAMSAKRRGVSMRVAEAEWQDVTGQDPNASGCHCCGQPHNFYEYDENDRRVW